MNEHACTWRVFSNVAKDLLPIYRFTINHFDPVIEAYHPPEDLRKRKSSIQVGKKGTNASLNKVLSSKSNGSNDHGDSEVDASEYVAPSKQGTDRFSAFMKSHYEYLCRKGILDEGTRNEKVKVGGSHYQSHWAAMKAFVRGEERKKRQLERMLLCRGSSGMFDEST
jgi:hypothetical protein